MKKKVQVVDPKIQATQKNGKLRQLTLDTGTSTSVKIDFDHSNNHTIITIGTHVFIVVPEAVPDTIVYKNDGDNEGDDVNLAAVLLKKGVCCSTYETGKAVIMDGDDTYRIGQSSLRTKDNQVLYRGKWYNLGDTVVIDGREAIIKETEKLN